MTCKAVLTSTSYVIHSYRENGAYRELDAMGARAMKVENVGEIGGEIGDGVVLRLEEKPASLQAIRFLRFGQNVEIFKHHAKSYSVHC